MSEFAEIISSTLADWGVEVEADSLSRLDGLDEEGLYSLMLACAQVIQQVDEAKTAYTEEQESTTLLYEDRWQPPRVFNWVANAENGTFSFHHGSWYIEKGGISLPYSFSHFGYLPSTYFPMERGN